jgi:hypothetical protein
MRTWTDNFMSDEGAGELLGLIETAITEFSVPGVRTRAYAGRGMYGRTCLAIEAGAVTDVFRVMVGLGVHSNDPIEPVIDHDALLRLRWALDTHGRGLVAYLPDVPWPSCGSRLPDEGEER